MNDVWQDSLNGAFRTRAELSKYLGLPEIAPPRTESTFPLLVSKDFADRMEHGNLEDPLLRQVFADSLEDGAIPGFSEDPVCEHQLTESSGILQKYDGRALIVTTGECAIHCRYCFRRHYPYEDQSPSISSVRAWLEQRTDIFEVILSGGDPLLMVDRRLGAWLRMLDQIPTVRVVRVHSRIPIVLPDRMTDNLLSLLQSIQKRVVLVVHSNHPQELSGECAERLQKFTAAGATVLNQSVLLQGVNDSAEVLSTLSWRLIELGVHPYYLHALDRVQGAAHFEVPVSQIFAIHESLKRRLPGYLVPRLVREEGGQPYKMPLANSLQR